MAHGQFVKFFTSAPQSGATSLAFSGKSTDRHRSFRSTVSENHREAARRASWGAQAARLSCRATRAAHRACVCERINLDLCVRMRRLGYPMFAAGRRKLQAGRLCSPDAHLRAPLHPAFIVCWHSAFSSSHHECPAPKRIPLRVFSPMKNLALILSLFSGTINAAFNS